MWIIRTKNVNSKYFLLAMMRNPGVFRSFTCEQKSSRIHSTINRVSDEFYAVPGIIISKLEAVIAVLSSKK